LEGLLEVVSIEVVTESVGAGTHSKSWSEWIPNFRSCSAEAVGAKWSANKRNTEKIGIWQPEIMSAICCCL